ncbi:Arc family DNA-binding protein [Methylocapsa sp. S129]|uniref:FitA-like ribbon-helix-helix domain-containing protein n=1 Tax=Methylocapsa sp. S129 TaxID=1641869 RepID=UPI00131B2633|nr:Arc family DNA-binding protein [Methylocapsa sp. S129]
MAQFVVRHLEDDVKVKLQRRAKRHKRSMEEEVRDILRDAVKFENAPTAGLGAEIAGLFREFELREDDLKPFPRQTLKPMRTQE